MRCLREETQEAARRGEGRTAAPESQGGAEGFEESGKAGGKGQEAEGRAERQGERHQAKWQAFQWPRRKIHQDQSDCREIRDFRQARGQAGWGSQRVDLKPPHSSRYARPCARHPRPKAPAARKTWMAGHRRAEATPSFTRLCPAMTEKQTIGAPSRTPDWSR